MECIDLSEVKIITQSSLDAKFTTESPDFLVKEKIHVHATLDGIHTDSIYPLMFVYFALVTSEGHQMPFQRSHILGEVMEKFDTDFFRIDYDTYLNFSSKYSCRLTFQYFNTTNISEVKIESEEIVVGPLLEVQPTSVGLQIRWTALQIDAANKTIGLALLIFVLTLITLLVTWIDKYEKLIDKLDRFFNKPK